MRKHFAHLLSFALVVLFLISALALVAHAATDVTANFTDANFRAVVCAALGKPPSGSISDEECATITALDARSMDIASLAGIQHLKNLSVFDCSENNLTGTLDFSRTRS